ncbi:MAG: hypothetical protein BWY90_00120 [Deltaproteobacteria bacterium ADurb.BinA014]|nr:MAG: hypothetical protein BWY90_00120 [Deltaproteobacteria bacterium ADurb.BinA014]
MLCDHDGKAMHFNPAHRLTLEEIERYEAEARQAVKEMLKRV